MGTVREEKGREEKRRRKKAGAKSRKMAKHLCSSKGSGWSDSRLAKAAGAERSGQMRDQKLHPVLARSTFASEKTQYMYASVAQNMLEHFSPRDCAPCRNGA